MEKNFNKENRGPRGNSGNARDNGGGNFRGEGRGGFSGAQRGGESNDLMVFGTRAVIEAVKSGKEFEKLFIQAGLQNELIKELITLLRKEGVLFQLYRQRN